MGRRGRAGGRLMCGVFGVRAPGRDVARLTYFGLYALQHRGQESAGIAVSETGPADGAPRPRPRAAGVRRAEAVRPAAARSRSATPATRRPARTRGPTPSRSSTTAARARSRSATTATSSTPTSCGAAAGKPLASTSDSEVIAALIADDERPLARGRRRGDRAHRRSRDGRRSRRRHAVRVPRPARLPAARARQARRRPGASPPRRARSTWSGRSSTARSVRASSCSSGTTASRRCRRVEPAERGTLCIFEFFYLARPDTRLAGVEVHGARVRMGERLAAEAPVEADLVLPIPDSGTPAAIGFARATGIPFSEGLIKNRYVDRTFIQPEQGMREQGIRMKFNPLAEVAGKRLVVVDDSIVRGSTTRQIVADAVRRRSGRGARADLVAAGCRTVFLRHRPRHRGRDDRGPLDRRGSSGRDRSDVPRVPLARGPPGGDANGPSTPSAAPASPASIRRASRRTPRSSASRPPSAARGRGRVRNARRGAPGGDRAPARAAAAASRLRPPGAGTARTAPPASPASPRPSSRCRRGSDRAPA